VSPREVPGLEPDEQVLAMTAASFRGALAATVRSTMAFGSARVRNRAFDGWRAAVADAGFPTAGPEMVLALTDRRVLVFHTSFWTERPHEFAGAVPRSRITQIAVRRHGAVVGLAMALDSGQIVEIEAMRSRRLRRFAAALAETAPTAPE
jgi:hypothetical protein